MLCRTHLTLVFLQRITRQYNFYIRTISTWPQEQIDQWISGANFIFSTLGLSDLDDVPKRVGLAVQFCLSFPQISSVLVGSLNEKEMEMNVEASDCDPLSKISLASVFKAFSKWESAMTGS